jgi:hypothetical protein
MSPRLRFLSIGIVSIVAVVGILWLVKLNTGKNGGLFSSGILSKKTIEPTTTARFLDSGNFSTSALAAIVDTAPAPAAVVTSTPQTVSVEIEKKGVERFARVFTEIYGSFSSDNNYQNILDVRSLATEQLWAKIKPPAAAKPPSTSFVGVTTNVVVTKLITWNETSATIEVEALRTETKAGKTTTFNQKATVGLVKQGSFWLVDSFLWKKM